MPPRSPWARLALGAIGMAAAIVGAAGACADVLHVTYRVSLIGLPIGAINLNVNLTPTSYSIQGDAKATGLARLLPMRGALRPVRARSCKATCRRRHSPLSPRIRT